MGFFEKISKGLKKTKESVIRQMDQMFGSFTKVDEELFEELEELLVMGDVGVRTSEKICDQLREKVKAEKITDAAQVKGALKEIITEMLSGGEELTQKEVADMLGISQSYISRLEKRIIGRLRKELVKSGM